MSTGVPAHKENQPGRKDELSYASNCARVTSPSQSHGLDEVIWSQPLSPAYPCVQNSCKIRQRKHMRSALIRLSRPGAVFGVGERRLVIRGPDVLISAEQFGLTCAQQVQMRRRHLVLEPMERKCARCTYGKILRSATLICVYTSN